LLFLIGFIIIDLGWSCYAQDGESSWTGLDTLKDRVYEYSKDYDRVISIGFCLGGIACLCIATLCDDVIAFNPAIDNIYRKSLVGNFLPLVTEGGFAEHEFGYAICERLERVNLKKTRIYIATGCLEYDLMSLRYLTGKYYKLKVWPFRDHNFIRWLPSDYVLPYLEGLISDALHRDLSLPFGPFAKLKPELYVNKGEFVEALKELERKEKAESIDDLMLINNVTKQVKS